MSEIIEVRRRLHETNDQCAAELRKMFAEAGTLVVELVSSPGSGKTTLLEMTVEYFNGQLRIAALLGDIATEEDVLRLQEVGASAFQIVTGGACHFDAHLVGAGISSPGFEMPDILFLENVSNLVCPASYDLGADFKTVLLSAPEGEDKPLKYPAIFSRAAVCLLTKMDLLSHLPFSPEMAIEHIARLNPDALILPISAMDGDGFEEWCSLLERELESKRSESS
jgi:hydrogenase nickel incorporation protein HypB